MEPSGDRLHAALDRLVARGVLDPPQACAVLAEVGGEPPRPGLRRLLAEIAGYLGAAFVAGAVVLFLGDQWEELTRGTRVAVLGGIAVLLAGAGVAVRTAGTGRAEPGPDAVAPGPDAVAPGPGAVAPDLGGVAPGLHAGKPGQHGRTVDDVRRRLASTLVTGAAVAAGCAAYAAVSERSALVATVVALAVVIAGYVLARSAVGQLGIAAAGLAVLVSLLDEIDADAAEAYGAGLLVLAAVWAALAAGRLVAEHRWALAIAVGYGLVGAQIFLAGDRDELGYGLTALVAAGCFAAYTRLRDWIVLAGGVVGATVAVPEFADDVTGGSLGASGVLLLAGVTLLGAGLAGLRIHRRPALPA